MRLLLAFLFTLAASCGSPKREIKVEEYKSIDSLISISRQKAIGLGEANKQSDSSIVTKVNNTVKKMEKMEGQIQKLQKENNELKDKLDDANDAGKPFSIKSISNH